MAKSSRLTSEERKRSILAAAVPLFAAKGFNGTTTKDIAKAAGVSEALLYRHFPSKESIYNDLKCYCMQEKASLTELISNLEPSTSTLVHIIYFITAAIVEGHEMDFHHHVDHDHMHRLLIKSYLEDGAFARLFIEEKLIIWEGILSQSVAAAVEAGEMMADWIDDDCRWWFAHHLAACIAMLNLPKEPVIGYGLDREQLVDQATRFSLRGMGLSDEAIAKYYNPAALALFMQRMESASQLSTEITPTPSE